MTELFAERYTLIREIGRGAFGVVYLAHDRRLSDRAVALKTLHPQLSVDPDTLQLFEQEAGALATLRHDHIVTVYDAGVWQGQRYLVMEYIEGASLAQVVKEQGAQAAERVAEWLKQAADALGHAHVSGIVHCDIKSANLLLERVRNRVYVSDFGLARAAEMSGGSSSGDSSKTLTGTAAYRAPEVRKTGHTVASDLYSLGVVGYELLAGRRPFEENDPLDMLMAHATDAVPELPERVPGWMRGVVMRLLAKEPGVRYASGEEVVKALTTAAVKVPPKRRNIYRNVALGGIVVAGLAFFQIPRFLTALTEMMEIFRGVPVASSNPDQVEEILIPAGRFQMGCDNSKDSCQGDEQPLHTVTLSAYTIDKYEVTNARYKACVDAGGCEPPQEASSYTRDVYFGNPEFADYPVIKVTWRQASAFCAWEGKRLPTEAEWEKAARGGSDTRKYPWGDSAPDCTKTNYDWCVGDTSRVGSHPSGASPYGVMDMAGNVWEWVNDRYDSSYVSPGSNPQGPATGGNRVLRGGSWGNYDNYVRSAYRGNRNPVNWYNDYLGFRCVRSQ
jgi:serine/threonine-protein kinase